MAIANPRKPKFRKGDYVSWDTKGHTRFGTIVAIVLKGEDASVVAPVVAAQHGAALGNRFLSHPAVTRRYLVLSEGFKNTRVPGLYYPQPGRMTLVKRVDVRRAPAKPANLAPLTCAYCAARHKCPWYKPEAVVCHEYVPDAIVGSGADKALRKLTAKVDLDKLGVAALAVAVVHEDGSVGARTLFGVQSGDIASKLAVAAAGITDN